MADAHIGYFEQFRGDDTILIAADGRWLREFAARLRTLENASATSLAVHALPGVQVRGEVRLTAFPCGKEEHLRRRTPDSPAPDFEWHLRTEGWLEAAEMIEALAEDGRGHQYLGSLAGADDATIVVAALEEYPPEWWERLSSDRVG